MNYGYDQADFQSAIDVFPTAPKFRVRLGDDGKWYTMTKQQVIDMATIGKTESTITPSGFRYCDEYVAIRPCG